MVIYYLGKPEFVDKIVVTDPPSAADDRGWFTGSFALRKADATT